MSIKYKGQTIANVNDSSASAGSSIPSGFIGMWSGTTIPEGWALCDGENGTPDLRGRFVLGSSDKYELDTVGGEETVKLTIEQIPEHNHGTGDLRVLNTGGGTGYGYTKDSSATGYSKHVGANPIASDGSNQAHNNMPPYYVLAYIMKL